MPKNGQLVSTTSVQISEGSQAVITANFSGNVGLEEYTTLIDTLPPATTAREITLGGLTNCDYVYIEADGDIVVQLNANDADEIDVQAYAVSGDKSLAKFELFGSNITSLFITNESTTESVKVKYIFAQKSS